MACNRLVPSVGKMPRSLAATAAAWSARHRRLAIGSWLLFVTAAFALGTLTGQRELTDVQMGNGQSKQAMAIYERAFPYHSGEQVLIQGRGAARTGDPAMTSAIQDVVGRLAKLPVVADIRSPLNRANRMLNSGDGRSAMVTFNVAGDSSQAQRNVAAALDVTAAAARAHPAVAIEEFGAASAYKALAKAYVKDAQRAQYTSIPVTLAILVLAFGALTAAGLPLLLGITAVMAALGLIGPLSHLIPVNPGQIDAVVALIGLAVGVDYSMFYLRRKLEERRAGHDGDRALARAAATSGRAVMISGLTVMASMGGMFLSGNAVFSSLAMGTVLVVAVAVLGSVTVLPAVISALGDAVARGRAPWIARRRERGHSRAWGYVIDHVLRVPALSLALSTAMLVALGIPALSMHTVDPGMAGLPPSLPVMQTYTRIQRAFPGGPLPALVVVSARDVTTPLVTDAITRMADAAVATGQMSGPVVVSSSRDRSVAAITLSLAGNGTDRQSERALATLRTTIIPATLGRTAGVHAYVAGTTAGSRDFNDQMKARLPLVFAFVLGLAFMLLLLTFRSLVIPLKTIVLNLLSVGAAYGVVTLIFQRGYLRGALGAQNVGGVIDWLPLFLFVVLFGLSMDYHVLILSRIREAHLGGMTTADAVGHGIKSTAGVVTSAAVVMVAVFSIFALLPEVTFKQLGVGLAVAVLIDATLVRAVLLPSAMTLLGEWNWWLPGRPNVRRTRRSPVRARVRAAGTRR